MNQIQAVLSEKSSSSLLHEVHIKGGLERGKWAQMLILFNRCRSVDYKNAVKGSMSVSTLLLKKVLRNPCAFFLQMFCLKKHNALCLNFGISLNK